MESKKSDGSVDIPEGLKGLLLSASDNMIDDSMKPLIQKWDDAKGPNSLEVLEVLDKCINGSLATGVVIHTLQVVYDILLEKEKRKHEDNLSLATWRA